MRMGREGRRERGRWGDMKEKRVKPTKTQGERKQNFPPPLHFVPTYHMYMKLLLYTIVNRGRE